jgi:hypothetical protein
VAHVLGLRVFSITVGVGPLIYSRFIGDVRLRVHAYPFGGLAQSSFRDTRHWKLKQFLVVASVAIFAPRARAWSRALPRILDPPCCVSSSAWRLPCSANATWHDRSSVFLAAARVYYPTCPLLPRAEAALAGVEKL